jgi:hypothetical protein
LEADAGGREVMEYGRVGELESKDAFAAFIVDPVLPGLLVSSTTSMCFLLACMA